jgi:hypothetical protein
MIVQIHINESMDEIECNPTKTFLKKLKKFAKVKGEGDIQLIYHWYIHNIELQCYGWLYGECVDMNQHSLLRDGVPNNEYITQPSEKATLYGDIFIIKYSKKNVSPLSIIEYGEIYAENNYDDSDNEKEILETETIEKKQTKTLSRKKVTQEHCNILDIDTTDYTTI